MAKVNYRLSKLFNELLSQIPPHVKSQPGMAVAKQDSGKTIVRITFGPIQQSWFDASRMCDVLSKVRKNNENPLITGDIRDISDLPDKAYALLSRKAPVRAGDNAVYAVDDDGNCYLEITTDKKTVDVESIVKEATQYLKSREKTREDFHPSTTHYSGFDHR